MGRKLDLSHLSDEECDQILQVVQQSSVLEQAERQRLSEIEAEVVEEETKYEVLSKQKVFNEKNCIRCFSRFFFIFNKRHVCALCGFHVCKKCCVVDTKLGRTLCKACLKQREYCGQSIDWFYSAVSKKFRQSASAKVIHYLHNRRTGGVHRHSSLHRSESDSKMSTARLSGLSHRGFSHTATQDGSKYDNEAAQSHSLEDVQIMLREVKSLPNMYLSQMSNDSHTNLSSKNFSSVCLSTLIDSSAQTDLTWSSPDALRDSGTMTQDEELNGDGEMAGRCLGEREGRMQDGRGSADLLRLAEGVTRSQGQMGTTATRMMHSADAMSSMFQELDDLDKRLDTLEGDVDDVITYDDDYHHSLLDQSEEIKSSAEAVGVVTSAALSLLSSTQSAMNGTDRSSETLEEEFLKRQEILKNISFNPRYETFSASSQYNPEHSTGGRITSEDQFFFDENFGGRFQDQMEQGNERYPKSGSSIDEKWESSRESYSRNLKSTTSDVFDPADIFQERGSLSGTEEHQTENKLEILRKDHRCHSSRRSLTELEEDSNHRSPSIKETEEEIYLAASRAFSLEEHVRMLEEQVRRLNELSETEEIESLENQVAKAVAQVSQSDRKVSEIEETLNH